MGVSCTVRERGFIVYSYRTWVYHVLLENVGLSCTVIENVGLSCTVRERVCIVYC